MSDEKGHHHTADLLMHPLIAAVRRSGLLPPCPGGKVRFGNSAFSFLDADFWIL